MKITVQQEIFSALLGRAQAVLERKSTRPILENVLLDTWQQNVRLSATDLRVSLVQECACEVERPGSVSLPGRKLHEIVREVPRGPVTLELKENRWVTVTAGKGVFHLPGTEPAEYPTLPRAPEAFASMEARLFREMLEKTLFAASSDESRMNLCGVFICAVAGEAGTPRLRMVATDGPRLSLSERPLREAVSLFGEGVIVPKKGLAELKSLLEECEGDFSVAAREGKIFARIGTTDLAVTLIDGAFPNYEQVVPAAGQHGVRLRRADLIDALRRVSLLSDQESRSVILEAKDGMAVLTSADPRSGDAREELEASCDGAGFRVAFNASYVVDALKVMGGDEAIVSLNDALSPCLLRTKSEPGSLWVVMPMRIE